MKVLIVSDTHRKNENYFKVLQIHKPDLVIHCGDVEGSEHILAQAADCPVQIVLGNNDFFSSLPRELDLKLGPCKVWVTHGHTHRPVVDQGGGVTAVNPGSISYPRQEGHRPSYALMEVEGKEVHFHIEYV